jgi:hypothetical protein
MDVNSKKIMVGLVVTVLVVIVWACTGIQGRTQNNPAQVDSADGLTAALSVKAMAVDPSGTISQPFFEPEGQVIRVDGEEVLGPRIAGR